MDLIPSKCSFPSEFDTCSKFIWYGLERGASLQQICETPWKVFQEGLSNDGLSCPSSISGYIKDTCRVSCNDSCTGE